MKPGSEGRRILPVFFSAIPVLLMPPSAALASIPGTLPQTPRVIPKIRVLLKDAVPAVRISGVDLSLRSPRRGVQFQGRMTWDFTCERGKIRVRTNTGSGGEFRLPEPISVSSSLQAGSGGIQWEERPIREVLKLYTAAGGRGCQVINELDFEHYLVGVVNGEFSSKWNDESIAAQVVAARTYAWHQVGRARRQMSHYDVEAGTGDQVYAGAESEDLRARMLVERTRGQVLVAPGRGIASPAAAIKAFYHSTCGGMTDSPDRIFGERVAGLRGGVSCPYCNSSPRFRWQLKLAANELHKLMGFSVGDIRVSGRWDSGRIRELSVLNARSRKWVKVSGPRFRVALGPERLRSTAFEVTRESEGGFVFSGRGNGHGVGMCQWGAKEMGERGENYVRILSHYYPASRLQRVW